MFNNKRKKARNIEFLMAYLLFLKENFIRNMIQCF
jgi:hypothetical protein